MAIAVLGESTTRPCTQLYWERDLTEAQVMHFENVETQKRVADEIERVVDHELSYKGDGSPFRILLTIPRKYNRRITWEERKGIIGAAETAAREAMLNKLSDVCGIKPGDRVRVCRIASFSPPSASKVAIELQRVLPLELTVREVKTIGELDFIAVGQGENRLLWLSTLDCEKVESGDSAETKGEHDGQNLCK